MAIVPFYPNIVRYAPPLLPLHYQIPFYPMVYTTFHLHPYFPPFHYHYSSAYLPAYSYDYYTRAYMPTSYIEPKNPGNYWVWP